jgi:hypothetical protein
MACHTDGRDIRIVVYHSFVRPHFWFPLESSSLVVNPIYFGVNCSRADHQADSDNGVKSDARGLIEGYRCAYLRYGDSNPPDIAACLGNGGSVSTCGSPVRNLGRGRTQMAMTAPRVEPITHPRDQFIGVHLCSSAAQIFLPAALAPRVRRIAWIREI